MTTRTLILALLITGCRDKGTETGAPAGGGDSDPAPLVLQQPLGEAPPDPLAGSGVESCAVYQEERCDGPVLQQCDVYDVAAGDFPADVDPLLHRVLLYERWYDLYHQPNGLTADRGFVGETLAGTPEAEWGALEHFEDFHGIGDSAIWTGVALDAYAMRYLQTGTEADYARMEQKARQLVTLFEVTGVPGYLSRAHFLLLDPDDPPTDQHFTERDPDSLDHRDNPLDPADAPDLPAAYTDGSGTPMWRGNPSIDQYTGPMVAFPLVWGLLQDEDLRDRIATQLTCYLKRLRRVEIQNLQENQEALELVRAYFADGTVELDEDDIDLTATDTLVVYVLDQLNSENADAFDRSCPAAVMTEPDQVIDASDDDFLLDLVVLVGNLLSGDLELEEGIDHLYAVNIRGGDAAHMMHLAAMSYWFTGDAMYMDFLQDELIANLRADEVAATAGALILPKWCRSYYGPHITFPPIWALSNLLTNSALKTSLHRVMEDEMRQKVMADMGNAKFDLMYAGGVPADIATEADAAAAEALEYVRALGGNGGVLDDPRRTYTLDRQWVLDNMPPGIEAQCPTEEERATCEAGFDVLGIQIPGEVITGECTGAPGECPVGDGCADAVASGPMPMDYRVWEDFLWQRDPYKIGDGNSPEGGRQSPGLDLIEAFWLARSYGLLDEGAGQVLAWRTAGDCD